MGANSPQSQRFKRVTRTEASVSLWVHFGSDTLSEANPLRLVVHRRVLSPLLKEGVADDLGGYLKIPWGTCQEGVSSMCLFFPARPECKVLVALHLGIVRGPFWQWFTTRTLHCDPVCACVFMRTPETKVVSWKLTGFRKSMSQHRVCSKPPWGVRQCLPRGEIRLAYCQVAGLLSGGGLPELRVPLWTRCMCCVCPGPTVPPCGTSSGWVRCS